jgi:hypothetical protein
MAQYQIVTPAKAGPILGSRPHLPGAESLRGSDLIWVPVFAGMTLVRIPALMKDPAAIVETRGMRLRPGELGIVNRLSYRQERESPIGKILSYR